MSAIPTVDPVHVAIIMDGNGRWAERRGKSRIFGHRKGVEAVRNVVDACGRRGIPYLTLYAFSSENWNRPREEVRLLTELLFTTLESEALQLHGNGVRLRVIGDLTPFGEKIDQAVRGVQELTRGNEEPELDDCGQLRWTVGYCECLQRNCCRCNK